MNRLLAKPKNLPSKPGVYFFKDALEKIIYIGKAKNLRARVSQYFGKSDTRPQIPFLLNEAASLDYTVVNTELESLYLERTLIRQYLPRYNIELKDDKNFAFITIDYSFEIPQIGYARKFDRANKNIAYFGPYTAAGKIKNTLNTVRKIFTFCAAKKFTGKPCFYYHLHRCPGVCAGRITPAEYLDHLKQIEAFLAGHTAQTLARLKTVMQKAAKAKKFEKAASLRDQIRSLDLLLQRQNVILAKPVNWDIVSLARDGFFDCINLFKIRNGRMFDKENFVYEIKADGGLSGESPAAVTQKFLEDYYLTTSDCPKEIFVASPAENPSLVQNLLYTRFKKRVKILAPQKGKAKNLMRLGEVNAKEYLGKWLADKAGNLDKISRALGQLKTTLGLAEFPKLIECYDISNIQGTNAVGSMVVFKDGLPARQFYRKFKIRGKQTPDDFAMMRETLGRRLEKLKSLDTKWPKPDLLVIDGGKGQLSAAMEILNAYDLQNSLPIIGLAKRIEEIFLPNRAKPIILDHDQPALQLLQRLRDEAHRFGITYHRQLRSREATKSALDDIPGIGPKTKKLLKTKIGTVADIRLANEETLAKIVGPKLAKNLKSRL